MKKSQWTENSVLTSYYNLQGEDSKIGLESKKQIIIVPHWQYKVLKWKTWHCV